jgi:hypothetical protein
MVAIRRFLAGIHNNRFKTFIAHDGVFNTQSMFGQLRKFSSAIGILVPYWEKDNAKKTYTTFNPINLVENGTRTYYYQGGKIFVFNRRSRSFQAAQLRGIKVDFYIFPKKTIGF